MVLVKVAWGCANIFTLFCYMLGMTLIHEWKSSDLIGNF